MTTGKRFQWAGHGPSDRINRLRKEMELIDLELLGHREMLIKLRHVQEWVMLTTKQAREIAGEMKWRKTTTRYLSEQRRNKQASIYQWTNRQKEACMRTSEGNEEGNFQLNRPVRVPKDAEASLALAKDLSQSHLEVSGVRWDKARRILLLPLFDVAVWGHYGIEVAERRARSRERMVA